MTGQQMAFRIQCYLPLQECNFLVLKNSFNSQNPAASQGDLCQNY